VVKSPVKLEELYFWMECERRRSGRKVTTSSSRASNILSA